MPLLSKLEYEKRIRIVQEWILEDYAASDIIVQINSQWGVEERQAQRYIKEARKRWTLDRDMLIEHKRKQKVESLKKLKRSLLARYKGTPDGIRATMMVENKIILLEQLEPAKKLEISGKEGQPIRIKLGKDLEDETYE
ncbi:MAG TPA: hypothetical protein VN722_08420 [Hanamia sp.]|nr:hypothetical protein [Hanamia sp.]